MSLFQKSTLAGAALCVATFIAAAAMPDKARAQGEILWEETYGAWAAWAVVNDDGSPSCGVHTGFSDGRLLYMKVFEFGVTQMFLADEAWSLDEGQVGTVTVELGRYRESFQVEASASDELWFEVPDMDFLDAFARAWTMRVEFPRARPWEVSLQGTARAVNLMIECYQDYVYPFEERQRERSRDPIGGGSGRGGSPI